MLAGKPIHIVDDDPGFLKGIERVLAANDLDVKAYASAEEFQLHADLDEAACLILDVHLGTVSGIDLMHELSRRGGTAPVIFVTADDSEKTRRAAVAAGCSDFLPKPISAKVLIEAVRKAVQKSDR